MGDTQGRGWLSCAHPLAVGHTRPESQRPRCDPATVGQAEPQAKSMGHQPQQNRPGGREQTAVATKGQARRETGRPRAVLRETCRNRGVWSASTAQRTLRGAGAEHSRAQAREHSPCFSDEVSSTVSVMKL